MKDITCWCVYNKGEEPELHSMSFLRKESIEKFCSASTFSWKGCLGYGWYVKKVKITPMKPIKEPEELSKEEALHDFTGFLMKRNITLRVRMDSNSMAQLVIDYLKSKENNGNV